MRAFASAVLAVAAAGSTLSSAGLAVATHQEPPGSGPLHEHPVTAYRFPLLLLAGAPGIPSGEEIAEHVRAGHLAHVRSLIGISGPGFEPSYPLAQLAGAVALALLVLAVPRLPRPSRRPLARLAPPAVPAPQWRSPTPTRPPRGAILRSV